MPSQASLDAQCYYGLPRNAFWRIMGELFDAGPERDYADRLTRVTAQGIAIWDVLSRCQREGSLDSAIDVRSAQTNDFAAFFRKHRSLRQVIFNGATAANIYRRRVLPEVTLIAPYLSHTRLPSTSPAMASLNFEQKLSLWAEALTRSPGKQ